MRLKIVIAALLSLILALIAYKSYKGFKVRMFSSLPFVEECVNLNDDSFDIGIIGDSWVEPKIIDIGLQSKLSTIKNLKVTSFSQGGARSKKIFENLLLPKSDKFSSKPILNGGYDAVIIIAGVNDVDNYSGKDFYSFHLMKIVSQLEKCAILPIVVSIPEYGVEDWFEERSLREKIFNDIPNRLLFHENQSNPIDIYNEELKEHLGESNAEFLYIEFDRFIDDYHKSKKLYADPTHLNREGYIKFGEFIGGEILDNLDFVRANTRAEIMLNEDKQ